MGFLFSELVVKGREVSLDRVAFKPDMIIVCGAALCGVLFTATIHDKSVVAAGESSFFLRSFGSNYCSQDALIPDKPSDVQFSLNPSGAHRANHLLARF